MTKKIFTALLIAILIGGNGCSPTSTQNPNVQKKIPPTTTQERAADNSLKKQNFPKNWGEFKITNEGPLDKGKRVVFTFPKKDIRIAQFSKDYNEGVTEGLCLCFKTDIDLPTSSTSTINLKAYISQTLNPKIVAINPQIITLEKNIPALLFYTDQTYAQHQFTAVIMVPKSRDENSLIATIGLSPWQDTPYKTQDINKMIETSAGIVEELKTNLLNISQDN